MYVLSTYSKPTREIGDEPKFVESIYNRLLMLVLKSLYSPGLYILTTNWCTHLCTYTYTVGYTAFSLAKRVGGGRIARSTGDVNLVILATET